jgi:hypothetical protein
MSISKGIEQTSLYRVKRICFVQPPRLRETRHTSGFLVWFGDD